MRDHLTKVYEMTGQKPAELDVPDMPRELSYVWQYYLELKASGEVNYLAIKAFSDLMCISLTPSEVSLIMDFEKEYRRAT